MAPTKPPFIPQFAHQTCVGRCRHCPQQESLPSCKRQAARAAEAPAAAAAPTADAATADAATADAATADAGTGAMAAAAGSMAAAAVATTATTASTVVAAAVAAAAAALEAANSNYDECSLAVWDGSLTSAKCSLRFIKCRDSRYRQSRFSIP